MADQFLQAMLLTAAVAGLTSDTDCPKNTTGQISCKKTLHALHVTAGDSLILNCTCFNKTNGQWTGPTKPPYLASDHDIPYGNGKDLNPKLNNSKYKVLGGYDDKECCLQITNFVSDDDGIYMCRYINSSITYIDVYNVTTYVGDSSSVNHNGTNTKTDTYTFETKREEVSDKTSLSLEWMLLLIVIIIIFGVVKTLILWRRKVKSESTTRWIEDIEENAQGDSFDNRLYQASENLEINNRQRYNRVSQNQALSSSQIHTDEGYSGVNGESVENRRYYSSEIPDISNRQGHNRISRNQALAFSRTDEGYKGASATVPATETTQTRRKNLSQNVDSQINGRNMHYAEVSFDVKHPTHRFVIHGNADRTVYSEIDHSIRAEPLPSSSSESEDD